MKWFINGKYFSIAEKYAILVPSFPLMDKQENVIIITRTHVLKVHFQKSAKCFPSFQLLSQCKLKFEFIIKSTNDIAAK